MGPVTPALQGEAAAVEGVRGVLEAGNAALDGDARQAQWYADRADRLAGPGLEPAAMLRCKARAPWPACDVLIRGCRA